MEPQILGGVSSLCGASYSRALCILGMSAGNKDHCAHGCTPIQGFEAPDKISVPLRRNGLSRPENSRASPANSMSCPRTQTSFLQLYAHLSALMAYQIQGSPKHKCESAPL